MARVIFNKNTEVHEWLTGAVITENPEDCPIRKNSNDTEYRWVGVVTKYPDGSEETNKAMLYEPLRIAEGLAGDEFSKGKQVELAIQLEGEGEGVGRISLPASRFELPNNILEQMKLLKGETATTKTPQGAVGATP